MTIFTLSIYIHLGILKGLEQFLYLEFNIFKLRVMLLYHFIFVKFILQIGLHSRQIFFCEHVLRSELRQSHWVRYEYTVDTQAILSIVVNFFID